MIFSVKQIKKSLETLNPDRIYIENIRSVLGSNTRIATIICNIAVRQGFFVKRYALACKNDSCDRILASYSSLDQIPKRITCDFCEEEGKMESTFNSSDLDIIPFYKYVKNSYNLTQTDLAQ